MRLATRCQVCDGPGRLFFRFEVAMRQNIDDIGHQVHLEDAVNLLHCSRSDV